MMRHLVFRQSDGMVLGHFDSRTQAEVYRSMLVPGGDDDAVLGIKKETLVVGDKVYVNDSWVVGEVMSVERGLAGVRICGVTHDTYETHAVETLKKR